MPMRFYCGRRVGFLAPTAPQSRLGSCLNHFTIHGPGDRLTGETLNRPYRLLEPGTLSVSLVMPPSRVLGKPALQRVSGV